MGKKIAVTYYVTNEYVSLFNDFYSTFYQNFCSDENIHFVVFTNKPNDIQEQINVTVFEIPTDNRKDQLFKKFQYILMGEEFLKNFDYIVYLNGNCRCIRRTTFDEMFGGKNQYQVHHGIQICLPSKESLKSSLCHDKRSNQYFDLNKFQCYFQAGNIGAKTDIFLNMCKCIESWRIDDFNRGVEDLVPWNDETYYNKYMNTVQNLQDVNILQNGYIVPMVSLPNHRNNPNTKIITEDKKLYGIKK